MNQSETTTYSVPEISCGHCKSTIEAAVGDVDDVRAVDVDIDAKTVTVEGGQGDAIVAAIEDAGYDIAR
ncbi:MAG: heavy-metal-associated domain-containing protein [Ilumatobacter sp.]|uniref:heavy-metal-associated domain-containing protein n=1 Tax=Ilumatobacter sp. TaxID=1967498 RepID=UPI003296FBEE